MTVTIDRTASTGRAPSPRARVSLTAAPGSLDGVWWPRSRALTRELPPLADAVGGAWGRITGITVSPAHWPVIPRWVSLAGRIVRVDWSAERQDPHRLTLVSASGRRDMLVIPPETGAAAAAELMGTAAVVPCQERAADAADTRGGEEAWETDGGAGRAPSRPGGIAGRRRT
ncbi:DUF5994 family protein [Streptomyces rochei]|uniref:DUF5994 family protein n=1 Tax=Streptomyces TaxID=1883 RepID=UPI0004CC73B8|nr:MULTISPECIES: DUF5994 family protein [unclassified Streptomyces]MBQ0916334.1 hypothetical protein [Streptomyces sp. RM99]